MLNENAKKWVEALRSGKYRQCRDQLAKPTGAYCCLGVACEVYQKAVGDLVVGRDTIGRVTYDDQSAGLPHKVREWLGLRTRSGEFRDESGDWMHLTQLNDEEKRRFRTIAKVIESEPEGLFETGDK